MLKRGFDSGLFDENLMENIDETHFVVNMDNGRTLGFWGDFLVLRLLSFAGCRMRGFYLGLRRSVDDVLQSAMDQQNWHWWSQAPGSSGV